MTTIASIASISSNSDSRATSKDSSARLSLAIVDQHPGARKDCLFSTEGDAPDERAGEGVSRSLLSLGLSVGVRRFSLISTSRRTGGRRSAVVRAFLDWRWSSNRLDYRSGEPPCLRERCWLTKCAARRRLRRAAPTRFAPAALRSIDRAARRRHRAPARAPAGPG